MPKEPPTPPAPVSAASVSAPVTNPAPATVAAARPPTPLRSLPPPPAPKRTILQKINPLNWFGGKTPAAASSPPPSAPAASPSRLSAAPSVRPARTNQEPPRPAPPSYPRYAYRAPAKPPPGNREEASRWLAQGIQAHRDRRLPEAIAAYRKAIEGDPACFEACYNLGTAACETADWPQALLACEQALAIQPEDANARFNFALALQRGGYPVDAARELEKLLAAHPDEVSAHFTLANLCAQNLAEPQRAKPHYARVLELQPGHPQATAIRRWLAANP
jgi:tetratricopeptide (TPR) repeat protein